MAKGQMPSKTTGLLLQFLTRPFVVGDRIELKTTSGGTVLIGIVEKIDPMRTVLRTDGTVPVAVPNKAITDMIVSNESRIGRSEVVAEFKVSPLWKPLNPLEA